MAKIQAEYVRHGPIRWLLRIAGIMMLISGIAGMMGFEGSLTYLTDSPIQALATGIICIVLDIVVAITDPRRKAKKAAASAYSYNTAYTPASGNAALRAQMRQTVLTTLQQVRSRSDYPQVLQSCNAPQMESLLRTNKNAAVEFCKRTGKIEVLAYVQVLNPAAAEVLIQELVTDLCRRNTAGTK